jgi:tetratricopeptide (TPR) repeat protein
MSRLLTSSTLVVALGLTPLPAAASPFAVPTIDLASDAAGQPDDSDESSEDDDPATAEAKAEYRAGSDAYALSNYEEAVAHFERAYELSQQPALLFNLGQSYTRWYSISNDIEHLKKARRLYENYVLNVGATNLDEQGQADARADAQRRIAEVDRMIAAHKDPSGNGEGPGPDKQDKPVHKKAWFWVAIIGGAALIGGGVAAAVLLTRPDEGFVPELGTLGRGGLDNGLTLRF